MKHSLLSIDQLSRETFTRLFRRAHTIQAISRPQTVAAGKILIPLFFEVSTRTRLSFETAMLRLGGQVLPMPPIDALSTSKGESLADTIRVISGFGDVIVMRHPDEAAVYQAAEYASIPLINGGNGCDEHPTQALLDLYTIEREKGTIDGLNIGLVGDLLHARTMHSLVKGLSRYQVKFFLISPQELPIPEALRTLLQARGCECVEGSGLREMIGQLDVLYIVMLQHHRIADQTVLEKLRSSYYRITPELLRDAKSDLTLLHPLVRMNEVASEVDVLPNAAYFRQAHNGVFLRMALLEFILTGKLLSAREAA